jgi:RecG-like helicase
MPLTSPPESVLSLLTPEQHSIASQIIDAVMQKTDQLMLLQGSVWSGKTFMVKALIKARESTRKKALICGTTGIAAVQYPGETTLHSLFHLGIDEQFWGNFPSNVGAVPLWLSTRPCR